MRRITWEESIERGTKLVRAQASLNWDIGDLLNETFPYSANEASFRKKRRNETVYKTLRRWKEQTGFEGSVHTLIMYRQASHAWPASKRKLTGWTAHWILRAHPDRFKLLRTDMTVKEAKALAGHQSVDRRNGEARTVADGMSNMRSSESFLWSAERVFATNTITAAQRRDIETFYGRLLDALEACGEAAGLRLKAIAS